MGAAMRDPTHTNGQKRAVREYCHHENVIGAMSLTPLTSFAHQREAKSEGRQRSERHSAYDVLMMAVFAIFTFLAICVRGITGYYAKATTSEAIYSDIWTWIRS